MDATRSRYGLLVSAFGAAMLAAAVFLPWYGPGRTPGGGRVAATAPSVSAIDAIEGISIALLVLAFLALTDALLPLVRHVRVPAGAGASLGLLGVVAAVLVALRMVDVPGPVAGAAAQSLRGGAWLALAGSVAIAAGGCWPRVSLMPPALVAQSHFESGWSGLSGWTTQR
jgi:hypothetical protein